MLLLQGKWSDFNSKFLNNDCRCYQQNTPEVVDDVSEMSDIGENEDDDVKTERLKVKNLLHTHTEHPPVIIAQVRKVFILCKL